MMIIIQSVCPDCGGKNFIKAANEFDFTCQDCNKSFYMSTQLSGYPHQPRCNQGCKFHDTPDEQERKEKAFKESPEGKEWIEFRKHFKKYEPTRDEMLIEQERVEVKPLKPPLSRIFYMKPVFKGDEK